MYSSRSHTWDHQPISHYVTASILDNKWSKTVDSTMREGGWRFQLIWWQVCHLLTLILSFQFPASDALENVWCYRSCTPEYPVAIGSQSVSIKASALMLCPFMMVLYYKLSHSLIFLMSIADSQLAVPNSSEHIPTATARGVVANFNIVNQQQSLSFSAQLVGILNIFDSGRMKTSPSWLH